MGLVFLAEHRRMGRRVALKTLSEMIVKNKEDLKRFQQEVRATAKLSHPNIVTAYDAGEAKGIHYFVMEYVEGEDLSRTVKQHGPLAVNMAVQFILQRGEWPEIRTREWHHSPGHQSLQHSLIQTGSDQDSRYGFGECS